MSGLCGVFRFRGAVGVDWVFEVWPVPVGAGSAPAAAASGAGADDWLAAWLAAKRAADLVSLGDMRSACACSGGVESWPGDWMV